MSRAVNLELGDISVRVDHQRHVALPFRRERKRVDYIAFEGGGPQHVFSTESSFDEVFSHTCEADPKIFVPKFLKAALRAFIPGDGVVAILLEILRMATLNGKEMKDATIKDLTEHFNALRKTRDLELVGEKCFNKKILLVEAIEKLEHELATPTSEQMQNKEINAAAAEKRLSGLAPLKEAKAEAAKQKRDQKTAAKTSTKAAKSAAPKEPIMATSKKLATSKPVVKKGKAAKAAPAKKITAPAKAVTVKAGRRAVDPAVKISVKTEGKGRGMGIGAFCIDLILKGKTNGETAEAAVEKFGGNTTASSVAWYRNKLKAEGKL